MLSLIFYCVGRIGSNHGEQASERLVSCYWGFRGTNHAFGRMQIRACPLVAAKWLPAVGDSEIGPPVDLRSGLSNPSVIYFQCWGCFWQLNKIMHATVWAFCISSSFLIWLSCSPCKGLLYSVSCSGTVERFTDLWFPPFLNLSVSSNKFLVRKAPGLCIWLMNSKMGFLPAAHLCVAFVEGMAFSPKPKLELGLVRALGFFQGED